MMALPRKRIKETRRTVGEAADPFDIVPTLKCGLGHIATHFLTSELAMYPVGGEIVAMGGSPAGGSAEACR